MSNLAELEGKIYLPEDFDQKFKTGEIPRTLVTACASMTLFRFLKDVHKEDVVQDHWLSYFEKRFKEKEKSFWIFKRTKTVLSEPDIDEISQEIQSHREYFRWQMGIRDVLNSQYPDAAKKIYSGRYSGILYINREYPRFKPLQSIDELTELVKAASPWLQNNQNYDNLIATVSLLTDSLGSLDIVNQVLQEARHRQGVQVIYGNNSFSPSKFPTAGDYWSSVKSPKRVDPRYITAVLPIGDYEQGELWGKGVFIK